jgi:V/A-type H+-transporting ATPase subunit I
MSIEKMIMLNMVGHMGDIDKVSKAIVRAGCMQPVNAMQEIDTTDFTVKTTEDNLDVLMDVCYIRPYNSERDYTELQSKMDKIKSICPKVKIEGLKNEDLIYDYSSLHASVLALSGKLENTYENLLCKKSERDKITEALEHLKFIKGLDISLGDLNSLKYLDFRLMKISTDNMKKLKGNYENIPSIVISIYKAVNYEIIVAFTPYVLMAEAHRIFKSLNCEAISLPTVENGTPQEISDLLQEQLEKLEEGIKHIELRLKKIIKENMNVIAIMDKSLELEIKSNMIKNTMACTNEFFYFSGWVPQRNISSIKAKLNFCEERLIITEKEAKEVSKSIVPPTSMKNCILVKPFESMVSMYGIPSYGEVDPTFFLAISYMILFGAMFGDVGQGSVFILAGIYLMSRKNRPNLGGVLIRLGISSAAFGLAYGSIFGFEELPQFLAELLGTKEMPHFFIRPMENIMDTLSYGVILGCMLLIVSFIYSLINNYKKRDVKNGVFGKEGLVGMLFFIALLAFAYCKFQGISFISDMLWYGIFILALLLMLLQEPLGNLIKGKRPLFEESKTDYFIEGGFGIIEILISLFSNTLSFIRVGAFALNHVGLFMAFTALAKMMQGGGSVFMYILGNIIIIGLEGLIVFIQGLRLEYYELFSKYFEGGGVEFQAIKINNTFIN